MLAPVSLLKGVLTMNRKNASGITALGICLGGFALVFLGLQEVAFAQLGGGGGPIPIPESEREYQRGRIEGDNFWSSEEGREWRETIEAGDCATTITCAECRDAATAEATGIFEFPTEDNQSGKREYLGERFGCPVNP